MPGTVSIACKLPSGLQLCIYNMEDTSEPVMGGGWKTVKRAIEIGRVTIRGAARRPFDDPRILGGYAITENVDADVWEKWLKDNEGCDLVKKGLIFAAPKLADVQAHARAGRDVRNGFEEIDPENLPPEFKRTIKTADEHTTRGRA